MAHGVLVGGEFEIAAPLPLAFVEPEGVVAEFLDGADFDGDGLAPMAFLLAGFVMAFSPRIDYKKLSAWKPCAHIKATLTKRCLPMTSEGIWPRFTQASTMPTGTPESSA